MPTPEESQDGEPGNGPGAEPVTSTQVVGLGATLAAAAVALLIGIAAALPTCDRASESTRPQPAHDPDLLPSKPRSAGEVAISSLEPAIASTATDTTLTIKGRGLSGAPEVLVGGIPASQPKIVDGVVTAQAPRGKPGAVEVIVRLTTGPSDQPLVTELHAGWLVYVGTLQVTGVSPAAVSPLGGDAISLTGSGFGRQASVTIGGARASDVTVHGESEMSARVPPGRPGPTDVTVRLGTGTATLAGKLTYQCPPPDGLQLLVLVVLAGALGGLLHALRSYYTYVGARKLVKSWVPMYLTLPLVGGTLAVVFYLIVGAGLLPLTGTQPGFGVVGVSALVGLFSSQAIAKLTRIAEGIFTQAPKSTDALNEAPVAIASIVPATGKAAGGDVVTMTGTGFGPDIKVSFGGVAAPTVKLVSDKVLEVTTPAAAAGAVDVAVSRANRTPAVRKAAFTYV